MKNMFKILFVIIALIICLYVFNTTANYSSSQDLTRVEETINTLCLKCYSIEGSYPKDIYYLKKYYGLLLNEDDYRVIYYYEGANLAPVVKVYVKG